MIVFDFGKGDISDWRIVNDGVMGGLSTSSIKINDDGHGVFSGHVTLENNGGFASVRLPMESKVETFSKIVLRVKGDGKAYQLRARDSYRVRYSHAATFQTTGEWETIEVEVADMKATFRGRTVNVPPYDGENLTEIALLIGNKKEEDFTLIIDFIKVM